MKKINIIYTFLTLLLVMSFVSCQKDEKIGGTAVQSVAGEYWIKIDGGNGEFGDSYYTISTYNTAANSPTEMWIDDGANNNPSVPFWDIKGKVKVNGLTFSGANIANQDYDSSFTITDGKVIPGAATAPGTKTKTDSIYFKIRFSDDDPIVDHVAAGYLRTKFDADDHY